jgi:hypothetical protein
MCNNIDSHNTKASDRSNDHDSSSASENDNNRTRRLMKMLKCQGSG